MTDHPGFSTIIFDGFMYRLLDEIPQKLLFPIIGKVELYELPPMHTYPYRVSLQICDNCLKITELTCHVVEYDALQLVKQFGQNAFLEYKKGFRGIRESVEVFECCAVTIKDINETIPYTGHICARQVYVDEVDDGVFKTHDKKSRFCFIEGRLQADTSAIAKDRVTFISKVTWHKELENDIAHPDFSVSKDLLTPKTMYYVNPTGNVRQNNMVISIVTWYRNSGRIDHKVLDAMLQSKHPVLRSEIKSKSDANKYISRKYDLVEEAVEGLELNALRKMAPYIAYKKYLDYPEKLLAAVLFKAKNTDSHLTLPLLEDIVDALEILQQSGLQDSNGANVRNCATEFFKLASRTEDTPAGLQFRAMTALCNMTSNERIRSDIRSLF